MKEKYCICFYGFTFVFIFFINTLLIGMDIIIRGGRDQGLGVGLG